MPERRCSAKRTVFECVLADRDGKDRPAFRVTTKGHALAKPATANADRQRDDDEQYDGKRQAQHEAVGNQWQLLLRRR